MLSASAAARFRARRLDHLRRFPGVATGRAGAHSCRPTLRVARELGVDVLAVVGSAPGGRVVARDVEAAARRAAPCGGHVPLRSHRELRPVPHRRRPWRRVSSPTSSASTWPRSPPTPVTGASPASRSPVRPPGPGRPEHRQHRGRQRSVRRGLVRRGLVRHSLVRHSSSPRRRRRLPCPDRPSHRDAGHHRFPDLEVVARAGRAHVDDRRRHGRRRGRWPPPAAAQRGPADTRRPELRVHTDLHRAGAPSRAEHLIVNSQIVDEGIAPSSRSPRAAAGALDKGPTSAAPRRPSRFEEARGRDGQAGRRGPPAPESSRSTISKVARSRSARSASSGVDGFTPVISNAPNAAILGVGGLRLTRPPGRPTAWSAPSSGSRSASRGDHRILDGAPAARFASSIKLRSKAS